MARGSSKTAHDESRSVHSVVQGLCVLKRDDWLEGFVERELEAAASRPLGCVDVRRGTPA
jgi:hypothetical protein